MKRRVEAPMQEFIFARVRAAEKKAIETAAAQQGLSLSSFVRDAVTEAAQREAA